MKRQGRPPTENPRSEDLHLRLTKGGMAHIDKQRGSWSRQEYVRRALAQARDLKGPQ